MKKFVSAAALAAVAAALVTSCTKSDDPKTAPAAETKPAGQYASVNGLNMYYEIHGEGRPVVLLHGAISGIDTDFGDVLPNLAKQYKVIAIEQQGHGHTADIDRPLSYDQMAADTVELLRQIGVGQADFLGYSMGAAIAMDIAVKHPDLVRKLVVTSSTNTTDSVYPGLIGGPAPTPEQLEGSPFANDYKANAPRPQDWPALLQKVGELDAKPWNIADDLVRGIKAPTQVIVGDSDIITPEGAVALFKLRGGGVPGDLVGMPNAELAILPGTSHITAIHQADLLNVIVPKFLDK